MVLSFRTSKPVKLLIDDGVSYMRFYLNTVSCTHFAERTCVDILHIDLTMNSVKILMWTNLISFY